MSVQAGVFYFDRRPVQPLLADAIGRHLATFGPDQQGVHLEPGMLMVYSGLHVTAEDRLERQPAESKRGNVITWDGRLDNRDELLRNLWRDLDANEVGDATLAGALVERSGTDGLGHLIGDWSLAFWNRDSRVLTLARDHLGVRPLYFRLASTHIAWSTLIDELVIREGQRNEIDPEYVRNYLAVRWAQATTPYRNIGVVPAGHFLTISETCTQQLGRHWWPVGHQIRYGSLDSYHDHFCEAFGRAVRSRLRAIVPVWAELSGGLDSSAIVSVADIQTRHSGQSPVETVSRVSDRFADYDERRFIGAVEERRGCRGVHIRTEDCYGLVDSTRDWIAPRYPYGQQLCVMDTVLSRGGRVILSGELGDQVTVNVPDAGSVLRELLRDHHYREFVSTLRTSCREGRTNVYSRLRELARARITQQQLNAFTLMLRWNASLCESNGGTADLGGDVFIQQLSLLQNITRSASDAWFQYKGDFARVTYTYPFADRRLIDFIVSIPTYIVSRLCRSRALLRHALSDILHPVVASRMSKTFAVPMDTRASPEIVLQLAKQPESVELLRQGFVERTWWTSSCAAIQERPVKTRARAVSIVTAEHWLRVRADRAEASPWLLFNPQDDSEGISSTGRLYARPHCHHIATVQGGGTL